MITALKKYLGVAVVIATAFYGCSEQTQKKAEPAQTKGPETMAPFKFHKLIEVTPGNDFDILSWGRGSNTSSSLLILHSDSADKEFTTTTGDLDGAIVDVFNSDMDIDGDPELLIEAKAKDTIDYTKIYAFEFNDNKANKLDFPKLNSSQKKGYRGNDNFYMKDGKLIREYPIYDGNTSASKPTGQKRVLQYNLRSNNLTVKDLSADTLKTAAVEEKQVAATEKKTEVKKTETKKSSSSKKSSKHKSTSKKKRHHR